LGHEGQRLVTVESAVSVEATGAAGDGQFQDGLCDVDPDESIVHVDSSFIAVTGSDSGTSMPLKSQEESIPSLQRTKPALRDGASPLNAVFGRPATGLGLPGLTGQQ
jgi:hypothetical protein